MHGYWDWLLSLVGVAGFILAGKKVWWAWYVNIAAQGLWFTYAVVSDQPGFFIGAIVYTIVFAKNAYEWTQSHRRQKQLTKIGKSAYDGFMKGYAEADAMLTESIYDFTKAGVYSPSKFGFINIPLTDLKTIQIVSGVDLETADRPPVTHVPADKCYWEGPLTPACYDPGTCGCVHIFGRNV